MVWLNGSSKPLLRSIIQEQFLLLPITGILLQQVPKSMRLIAIRLLAGLWLEDDPTNPLKKMVGAAGIEPATPTMST